MVRTIVISLSLAAALVGCGSKGKPAVAPGDDLPADTRTPIEQRRDAACEQLGPRLTACAEADSPPEELAREDHAAVARKNTEEFVRACKGQALTSRQVRVYEVCMREESDCDPLLACLDHVNDAATP